MAGRVRHRVTGAALAAGLAAALTVAIGQATALRDNPLAWLVVGLLITASAAVAGYVTWAGRDPAGRAEIEEALAGLAETSRTRWAQALNHRGLQSERLLEVPWAISSYTHADPDPRFRLRRTTRAEIEATAADLLAERARVLITGPAGAGKSSLAGWLAHAWLKARQDKEDPVPVLLPASSWTEGEPVPRWLERHLRTEHRALSRRTTTGDTVARHLVARNRVFPVVDGLDELPEAPRAALAEALRDGLAEGAPLILTCRPEAPRLPVHTVFTLRPVEATQPAVLLTKEATDPQRAAWERLFALCRKDSGSPLARMLARPLVLALAAEVYHRHDPTRDPSELATLPTEAAIEDHVLAAWLPAVLRRKRNLPGARAYRESAVLSWLTFLARHLERLDTYELRWWELRLAVLGRFRLPRWADPDTFRPPGQPQRALVPRELWQRLRDRWRQTRRHRGRRIARGLLGGAGAVWAFGGLIWLAHQWWPELVDQALGGGGLMPNLLLVDPWLLLISTSLFLGLFLGGMLALAEPEDYPIEEHIIALGWQPDRQSTPWQAELRPGWVVNPRQGLAADRRWSLLWLTGALAALAVLLPLTTAPALRQSYPLLARVGENLGWAFGLGVLLIGLAVFTRAEWPWFLAARATLSLSGLPPLRLLTFLDTMDSWDVLRREGEVYRFRHATLRDWLLRRAALTAYQGLSRDHQRLLRRLAVHPGPDFTALLVARLDDLTEEQTRQRLEDCVRVELLAVDGDRYRWRAGRNAIAELAAELDPPGLRGQVLAELRRGYLDLLTPHLADPPCPFSPGPDWLALGPAGWPLLRAEQRTVLACLDADGPGVLELCRLALPHLREWGRAEECTAVLDRLGLSGLFRHHPAWPDCPHCRADALNRLGGLRQSTEPAAARAHFAAAAEQARLAGSGFQEALAQIGSGQCLLAEEDFEQAIPLLRKGLATLRDRGGGGWPAELGLAAGRALYWSGRFRTARSMITQALADAERAGEHLIRADLHLVEAAVLVEQQEHAWAARSARLARTTYLDQEAPEAAEALAVWAEALLRLGKALTGKGADGDWATEAGRERLRTARAEFLAQDRPSRAADMLTQLGEWADRDSEARGWLTDALAEYERLADPVRIEKARELLAQRS